MHKNRANAIILILAAQLAALRKKIGMSHETLAKKAGVTRAAISFVENGKRKPTLLFLLKLACAMNINLSALLRKAEQTAEK